MLNAGRLTERVAILWADPESAVTQADGQVVDAFATLCTVWAEVLGLGGKETRKGEQIVSQHSHKVTIRYRTGITPQMQVRWKGLTLEIDSVSDQDGRKEALVLMCLATTPE